MKERERKGEGEREEQRECSLLSLTRQEFVLPLLTSVNSYVNLSLASELYSTLIYTLTLEKA